MSGRDGGTGEGMACTCGTWDDPDLAHAPDCPATSDADPASTSASEVEGLTEAEVNELVGDDIAFWLTNPFMTPDLIADKVRWWVENAATRARAEALREAAEEWAHRVHDPALTPGWLRARADSLDAAPRGDGAGA